MPPLSGRTEKMGTRTVAFQDGLMVFFRAVMDNALGEYLKAGLPDTSDKCALLFTRPFSAAAFLSAAQRWNFACMNTNDNYILYGVASPQPQDHRAGCLRHCGFRKPASWGSRMLWRQA